MNRSLRRFAVPMVLLLVLSFVAPTAGLAATVGGGLHWPEWLGFLSNLWAPTGCSLEPVGRCADAGTLAPQEEGCGLEPVGRCANASSPAPRDAGCVVDPVGRCTN